MSQKPSFDNVPRVEPDRQQPNDGPRTLIGAQDRRSVLAGGLSIGAAWLVASLTETGSLFAIDARAGGIENQPTPWFHEAEKAVTQGRPVEIALVKVELPDLAENGNMVPFSVQVESPMTVDSHVKRITILSPLNPQAFIASFELSPASGAARVQGRLRLAKTQDLLVIAELSDGRLVSGSKRVEVTVGGCGAG